MFDIPILAPGKNNGGKRLSSINVSVANEDSIAVKVIFLVDSLILLPHDRLGKAIFTNRRHFERMRCANYSPVRRNLRGMNTVF